MGVLGLHNECPPVDYAMEDIGEVAGGLIIDEKATAATLRATRDALEALACMDDTIKHVVSTWRAMVNGDNSSASNGDAVAGAEILKSFGSAFRALDSTVDTIDNAIADYRELEGYAAGALAKGRGECYEGALRQMGEGGFAQMARSRIEMLRKLRIRVQLVQNLEKVGRDALQGNDFREFFTLLMEPWRDLASTSDALYSEVVRGALSCYQAMLQTCTMHADSTDATAQAPARERVSAVV